MNNLAFQSVGVQAKNYCGCKLRKEHIMADIKLFRVGAKVEALKSSAVDLEKKL